MSLLFDGAQRAEAWATVYTFPDLFALFYCVTYAATSVPAIRSVQQNVPADALWALSHWGFY